MCFFVSYVMLLYILARHRDFLEYLYFRDSMILILSSYSWQKANECISHDVYFIF